MKHTLFNKPTLFLTVFLMLVVGAVGISASYKEPIAPWPVNTTEPIDTGMVNQAKVGPLSVETFFARGNADFKKDLSIEGVAQGGQPGQTGATTVQIASNVLATGELHANAHLSAQNITHNEPQPKPVCGDVNGIVVFCKDVCNNINGEQSEPPTGYTANTDGSCTALPDLCSNVPGIQQTLNADLSIDDSSQPTFCTQTIRATIYAWQHGGFAVLNMAHSAYMTNLMIKNITVTSVGGDPTRTSWPTATPLRFRWEFCAKRNPSYSGPGWSQQYYAGSIATGICEGFTPDYPYLSTLPYGTSKSGTWLGYGQFYPNNYIGFDGIHNRPAGWFQSEGYQLWGIADPKGLFGAGYYERTGGSFPSATDSTDWTTVGVTDYLTYVKLPPGGHPNEIYDFGWIMPNLEFILPLERLVLDHVKVPYGYKLVISNDEVNSPNTRLDVHPVRNSIYLANPGASNVTRVNAYIPGGYGVNLALDGIKWSDNLPNGTYQVSVQCSIGTGVATPSTITLPKDWGVGVIAKCQ